MSNAVLPICVCTDCNLGSSSHLSKGIDLHLQYGSVWNPKLPLRHQNALQISILNMGQTLVFSGLIFNFEIYENYFFSTRNNRYKLNQFLTFTEKNFLLLLEGLLAVLKANPPLFQIKNGQRIKWLPVIPEHISGRGRSLNLCTG